MLSSCIFFGVTQYFPGEEIHTVRIFVKIQQRFFAGGGSDPARRACFFRSSNFFAGFFLFSPRAQRQHNSLFSVEKQEAGTGLSTEIPGALLTKIMIYLLKTHTFPHSPQVYPQGFSTGTKIIGKRFS